MGKLTSGQKKIEQGVKITLPEKYRQYIQKLKRRGSASGRKDIAAKLLNMVTAAN